MRWIFQYAVGSPEVAGAVQIYQRGETAADDPLGGVYDSPEHLPFGVCAAAKPYTDAVCQEALYGTTIKGYKQILSQMVPPEYSQEEQSLLCLLNESSDVGALDQVLLDVEAQKLKVRHPPHTVSADEKGLNVPLSSPVDYDELLSLGCFKDQVVFRAPH